MWHHDCCCINIYGTEISKIRINEPLYNSEPAVIFGIFTVVVGCAWFERIAADRTLLLSQDATNLLQFVAREVLRYSGADLKMAICSGLTTRVGMLKVPLDGYRECKQTIHS